MRLFVEFEAVDRISTDKSITSINQSIKVICNACNTSSNLRRGQSPVAGC